MQDIINKDWLTRVNSLADQFEKDNNPLFLAQFTNDQLQYLIYWNWGYSNPVDVTETILSKEELKRRNIEFNSELAESINEKCEECYAY